MTSEQGFCTFEELGISPEILASLHKKGFEHPSPIQEKVIPLLLQGQGDIIGQAATGTGKTAAFGIPLLEKIESGDRKATTKALILTPTRELALQITEEMNSYQSAKKHKCNIVSIYGGQSYDIQLRALKKGADIIVGTPGRVIDHLNNGVISLKELRFFVLDEADEMLNMGFIDDIEDIFEKTPKKKQVLLFSATMPKPILNVAKKYMGEYQLVSVKTEQLTTTQTTQIYFEVRESDKFEALCRIIDIEPDFYGIVFTKTKLDCDIITTRLTERGYPTQGLHGDVQQKQRERILKSFKEKKTKILVATDVAARGIDISNITHVINYSLPQDTESYIHRVGRTGRAGKTGKAITFVTPQEYRRIVVIQRLTKTDIQKGTIPGIQEIIQARKGKLNADIEAVLAGKKYQQYVEVAKDLLQDKKPEEVIAALLKLNYQDGLAPEQFKEIQEVTIDQTGTTRLFLAFGRNQGYTPRSLVEMLQEETGVKNRDIDDVRVLEDFSFVTVPFEEAEVILQLFSKKKQNGRPLVTRAKEKKSDEHPRGAGRKEISSFSHGYSDGRKRGLYARRASFSSRRK